MSLELTLTLSSGFSHFNHLNVGIKTLRSIWCDVLPFFVIRDDILGVRLVLALQTRHSGLVVDEKWDGRVFSFKLWTMPLLHIFTSTWCNCVPMYIPFNYCVGDLAQGGLYTNINVYGINCVKRLYRWNGWSLKTHSLGEIWDQFLVSLPHLPLRKISFYLFVYQPSSQKKTRGTPVYSRRVNES